MIVSRSGLSVTAPMGVQLRVFPESAVKNQGRTRFAKHISVGLSQLDFRSLTVNSYCINISYHHSQLEQTWHD